MTAPGPGAEVAPSAMITGATGGIGRAIAGRLAHAGYRLTLSGRDEAALAKLAGDLAGRGAEPQVVPADMGREEDIRALARGHTDRFGSLDLLVLSAGTGTSGRIADYPMRRFDRQMTVNVRAPFALVQE
jgi:NAD(P)-dependent dehydrogenase (short-subunit alcohol dehydrogenase family)